MNFALLFKVFGNLRSFLHSARLMSVNIPPASVTKKTLHIFLVAFFLLSSQTVFGKTLDEYKQNLQRLKNEVGATIVDENLESVNAIFEKVPQVLPAAETVEVGETNAAVNNEWLNIEIQKYKAKTVLSEKRLILNEIYERLDAIEYAIDELQTAQESATGKDAEKRKLAEILNREEFQKPVEKEESLFQKMLKWLDEWLNQKFPKANSSLPASNFAGFAKVLQYLLYALLLGALGFLLYKFIPFFVEKYRNNKETDKNERIILGEKISADETSENLFSEAENLALNGNLRDAIRKGYIAFLFELSERKMIGLAKHKTNRDYLRAVRKQRELFKNMNGLTLNYERHWYGFEDAEMQDWEEFKVNYKQALNEK